MYHIMTLVQEKANLASTFKYYTEPDATTGSFEIWGTTSLIKLDEKVEQLLSNGYSKKNIIVMDELDYIVTVNIKPTVTYIADGKVISTISVDMNTSNQTIATPETPEKEGYSFEYWYDQTADEPSDFFGRNLSIASNIVLIAKYTLGTTTE